MNTVNYPITIEQQVRSLHEQGHSIRAIASYLGIDKSKVQRILKKLQESGDMDVDTAFDPLGEIVYQKDDTARDPHVGIAHEKGDTADVSPFDPGQRQEIGRNTCGKQPESIPKTYTLAEVQRILAQVWLFKQDYNEYVYQMVTLHLGNSCVKFSEYQGYARRAQRLTQSSGFILEQLQQDPKGLLVTQVLQSIHATIEAVVTGMDRVSVSSGQYSLTDRVRTQKFWHDSRAADFLEPKN